MRNDSIDNFRLELNKPSLRGSFYVRKGDTRARTIHVTITDNGKVKDLSDAVFAEILIKKDDGTQNDQAMVRDGNELQYTLRTQDINVKGECLCWIMVTFSDGAVLTTPTFSIWVSDVEVDQNLEKSTNEYTALSQIIVDVTATQKDIKDYTAEQKAIIDDSVAQADASAKKADTSAQDAAAKADEANGYAESAEQSYQNTVDKTVEAGSYAAAAKDDREACAEYLDDVTGIAASKMDKVNPTGTGVMFFDGQIVTDALTSDVVEVSTIGSQRGSDTIAIGSNVKIDGALNLSGYDVNDEIGKKLNKDNPRTSGTWIHQSGDIIVPSGSINAGNTVTAPNINGDSITAKNITATGDVQISGTAYVSSAGGSEIKVGYSARGGTKYTTINKDGIKSHSDTDSIVIAANGIDINSPIETDHYIKANTGRIAFRAPSGVHLGDSVTVGHINTTEIMGQEIMSKKAEDGYKLHRLSDKADKKDIIPPLILTSSSPLTTSAKANILGIDALGKSEQYVSPNIANPSMIIKGWFSTSSLTIDGAYGTIAICRVKPNTNYTYSKIKGDRTVIGLGNYNGDISEVGVGFTLDSAVGARTVNTGNHNVLVVYANSDWSQSVADVMMVSEGTVELPYVPYSGTPTPTSPIPIIDASEEVTAIGKNLFDKERCVNGYLDGNGNVVTNPQYRVSDYIEVGHSQITISGNKGGNEIICFFAEDKTKVSFFAMGSNNIKTLDVPQNAKYVRCTVSVDNLNVYQVEIGASATAYTEYQSNSITLPYTLKSVGTVADELIVNEDGSGKIVQRVIDYTFTSQGIWNTASDGAKYLDKAQDIIGKRFVNDETKVNLLCECLSADTMNNTRKGSNKIATQYVAGNDSYRLWVSPDVDVSDLVGKTLYLIAEAPIETLIETPLTPEEVASIRQLQTYKGTTVIDSEMQIESVTYSGDVKGYVDSKTDYSYTDQIIGKWADGKDLHRMVIQTTTPNANADGLISNLINGTTCSIKRISGMIQSADAVYVPISDYYNSGTFASIWIDAGGIELRTNAAIYANKPCEIIVEYTLKEESGIALLSNEGEVVADE